METESSFVQAVIPRFNGHYNKYSMFIENFLHSKEYWSLIEIGLPTVAEGVEPTEGQMKGS